LTAEEIITSSQRRGLEASLLHVRFEHPPKAARDLIYLTNIVGYVASLWSSEEIPDESEIDLLPTAPLGGWIADDD
jgi:hypothetical protein